MGQVTSLRGFTRRTLLAPCAGQIGRLPRARRATSPPPLHNSRAVSVMYTTAQCRAGPCDLSRETLPGTVNLRI